MEGCFRLRAVQHVTENLACLCSDAGDLWQPDKGRGDGGKALRRFWAAIDALAAKLLELWRREAMRISKLVSYERLVILKGGRIVMGPRASIYSFKD